MTGNTFHTSAHPNMHAYIPVVAYKAKRAVAPKGWFCAFLLDSHSESFAFVMEGAVLPTTRQRTSLLVPEVATPK